MSKEKLVKITVILGKQPKKHKFKYNQNESEN